MVKLVATEFIHFNQCVETFSWTKVSCFRTLPNVGDWGVFKIEVVRALESVEFSARSMGLFESSNSVVRDTSLRTSIDTGSVYQFFGFQSGKYKITVTHPEYDDE